MTHMNYKIVIVIGRAGLNKFACTCVVVLALVFVVWNGGILAWVGTGMAGATWLGVLIMDMVKKIRTHHISGTRPKG